ncbi:YhbD family protein [Halalkalibacter alkaliphilus]|uniref:YhbD family protein n=1 Tax=Halalkalibacter alkaliphilus TaxID=2917993 RepID=A0A9X1ZXK1_9BACI|nr:YhbD family protein [Halalkalibacter alkaliphilus]MCL7745507.1 YhbD family protein [Halalkalibacter alkaliphilus]
MDEELISKKDLLEQTDITYGQLYRWKRKKLIPDDWFIRKSTFTGQETFFPRDKMVERINRIKELKDTLSLDELANALSPKKKDISISKKDFIERNIVSKNAIAIFEEQFGDLDTITFQTSLFLYLLDKSLETGEVGWEEGMQVIQTLHDHFPKLEEKRASLVVLRKMGVVTVLLVTNPDDFYVDEKTKVAVLLDIETELNKLLDSLVTGGF